LFTVSVAAVVAALNRSVILDLLGKSSDIRVSKVKGEEIANGALELRDPAGRVVIRRAATDRDLKRLQAF
jgi:hypothetical protein